MSRTTRRAGLLSVLVAASVALVPPTAAHADAIRAKQWALDALHTQDQTARELVLAHGADYLLTVKDNQPTLRAHIEKLVPAPPAGFPPSTGHAHAGGSA